MCDLVLLVQNGKRSLNRIADLNDTQTPSVQIANNPVTDAAGRPLGVLKITFSVLERKWANLPLEYQQSGARLRVNRDRHVRLRRNSADRDHNWHRRTRRAAGRNRDVNL